MELTSPGVKVVRLLRREGPLGLARRGLSRLHDLLLLPPRIKRVPSDAALDVLLDFVFSTPAIVPMQVRSEVRALCEIVRAKRPKTIVEIGTAGGGTLFLWCRLADPSAIIISVDLPGGRYGGGYAKWRGRIYRAFSLPNQRLYLLRADSHDVSTQRRIEQILHGRRLDFLFIDGDHSLDGVSRDWEMYSPLMARDGIVAFHDIVRHPPEQDCHVDKFWDYIKGRFPHRELVEHRNQGWAGIGVIWID